MKQLLGELYKNRDNYNKLLTSLVLKNRTKNAQLDDNDVHKVLNELERKMQSNENSIFSLQTYIDSKTNDNKFGSLLKNCMDLQEKINEEILKHF